LQNYAVQYCHKGSTLTSLIVIGFAFLHIAGINLSKDII